MLTFFFAFAADDFLFADFLLRIVIKGVFLSFLPLSGEADLLSARA